jgi:hypothetical protein
MLQKQNGQWLMAAAQNIDSRPEVPTPARPVKK